IAWLLEQGAKRVAYVDVDVHHGDGVQAMFYDDPRVMTISLHESPLTLFPGTGRPAETGGPGAEGYSVNVALPAGTDDARWLRAFDAIVPPLLREFQPEVLVTQHGADAHALDPLAHLMLSLDGQRRVYSELHRLAQETAGGRWVLLGGGGYELVQVVPRAWTHLLAEACGAGLDPESATPDEWLRFVRERTDDVPPLYMTDMRTAELTPIEAGFDPADPVDQAIQATRLTVFPIQGIDPNLTPRTRCPTGYPARNGGQGRGKRTSGRRGREGGSTGDAAFTERADRAPGAHRDRRTREHAPPGQPPALPPARRGRPLPPVRPHLRPRLDLPRGAGADGEALRRGRRPRAHLRGGHHRPGPHRGRAGGAGRPDGARRPRLRADHARHRPPGQPARHLPHLEGGAGAGRVHRGHRRRRPHLPGGVRLLAGPPDAGLGRRGRDGRRRRRGAAARAPPVREGGRAGGPGAARRAVAAAGHRRPRLRRGRRGGGPVRGRVRRLQRSGALPRRGRRKA